MENQDDLQSIIDRDNETKLKDCLEGGLDPNTTLKYSLVDFQSIIDRDNETQLKDCLERGLDPNITLKYSLAKKTILQSACENGKEGCVEVLLNFDGIDVDKKDNNGKTALHYAAQRNQHLCLKKLLDRGADINVCDFTGKSPLQYAVNSPECIQLLFDKGSDVNQSDWLRVTFLEYFHSEKNCTDLINIFLKLGNTQTKLLFLHFIHTKTDCQCKSLLEKELKDQVFEWKDIFLKACHDGCGDCVKLLLMLRIGIEYKDENDQCAFHYAASMGHSHCIKLLADFKFSNININSQDEKGDSALHEAAKRGFRKCAETLEENGADLDLRNKKNQRPYEVALENKNVYTADFLEKEMKIILREQLLLSSEKGPRSSKALINNLFVRGLCFIFHIDLEKNCEESETECSEMRKMFHRLGYKVHLHRCNFEEYDFKMIEEGLEEIKPSDPHESFICVISVASQSINIDCEKLSDKLNHGLTNIIFIKSGNNNPQRNEFPPNLTENKIWFFFPRVDERLSVHLKDPLKNDTDSLSLRDLKDQLKNGVTVIPDYFTGEFDFLKMDEDRRKKYDDLSKGEPISQDDLPKELLKSKNKHPDCLNTMGQMILWKKSHTKVKKEYFRIGSDNEEEMKHCVQEVITRDILKNDASRKLVLSIESGVSNNSVDREIHEKLTTALQKFGIDTNFWLLTNGLSFGVSGLLESDKERKRSFVIGITPWRAYYDMEFDGDSMEGFLKADCLEDPEQSQHLDTNHTHFVFYQPQACENTDQCESKNRLLIEMALLEGLSNSQISNDAMGQDPDNSTLCCCGQRKTKNRSGSKYEDIPMEQLPTTPQANQQHTSIQIESKNDPLFIKIVFTSCKHINAIVSRAKKEETLLIVLKSKSKKSFLDEDLVKCEQGNNFNIHVTNAPEDIIPIIRYYVTSLEKSARCGDSKLMKAVIDNNIEAAPEKWKQELNKKDSLSHVMLHAFKNDQTQFIERFYDEEYMALDFLTAENMIDLYETKCKSQKTLIEDLKRKNENGEKFVLIGNRIRKLSGYSLSNIYEKDKKKESGASKNPFGERVYTEQDLFFWALLQRRFESARLFWKHGQDQIELAIIAVGILNNLKKESLLEKNHETCEEILKEVKIYESLAIELLKMSESISDFILNREIPQCENRTVLWLAEHNKCGAFLRAPVCRLALNNLWNPYFANFSSVGCLKAALHYLSSGLFCGIFTKSLQTGKDPICCLPAMKCIRFGVSHVLYFLLLTVMSIKYFKPGEIHWIEYVAFYWTMDVAISEFIQIVRLIQSSELQCYIKSNWNKIDLLYLFLLFWAFISRVIISKILHDKTEDGFLFARIPFNIALFFISVRLIQYYDGIRSISVAAIIAYEMFKHDVFRIGVIYASFLIGFGVMVCALKYPGGVDFFTAMNNIVHHPFWQLFGEVNVEFFEGDELTPSPNDSKQWISIYVILVFCGIVMIITNVLLINLLIAMFGSTYESIKTSAEKIWARKFFILFYEYEKKTVLPPPFVSICRLIEICCELCNCKKQNSQVCCYEKSIRLPENDNEVISDYFRSNIHSIKLDYIVAKHLESKNCKDCDPY